MSPYAALTKGNILSSDSTIFFIRGQKEQLGNASKSTGHSKIHYFLQKPKLMMRTSNTTGVQKESVVQTAL